MRRESLTLLNDEDARKMVQGWPAVAPPMRPMVFQDPDRNGTSTLLFDGESGHEQLDDLMEEFYDEWSRVSGVPRDRVRALAASLLASGICTREGVHKEARVYLRAMVAADLADAREKAKRG